MAHLTLGRFIAGEVPEPWEHTFTADDDGTAINLTGYSAKVTYRRNNSGAQVVRDAVISNAVQGKAQYAWIAADTATSGLLKGELTVQDGTNRYAVSFTMTLDAPSGGTLPGVGAVIDPVTSPVGLVGDITPVTLGSTALAGGTVRYADAGHRHAFPTAQAASLELESDFTGGDNTSDSTRRIHLHSHQRAVNPNHFGEAIRIDLERDGAKGMIAWREDYTGSGPRSVAWIGAHGQSNDGLSWHNHIAIEVPDLSGGLQTALEIPFAQWDTVDGFGISASDVYVRSVAKLIAGANAYVESADGTNRDLTFSSKVSGNVGGLDAHRRWSVRATSAAESGANAGTDFEIVRRTDGGVAVDAPLRITRSTGAITLAGAVTASSTLSVTGAVTLSSRLTAVGSASGHAIAASGASGSFSQFAATTAASGDRVFDARVSGDTSARLLAFASGKIEWGDGAARDTALERASTAQLRITPTANASNSSSVGGALNITNSASTGAGLVVYSTQAAPTGHLIVARANHATFNQSAIFVDYVGTNHGVSISHAGTGGASSALNVTSSNASFSTMQLSGVETTTGTLKLTHTGTGGDSTAAAVSLSLAGAGTAAQGIFLTGATTGDLAKLVNNSVIQFSVAADGDTLIAGDLNHDGSGVGFYGTAPVAKPTVTGSRGGNAAVASLITALASLGLLTDSTTA
ncbi:MAG: BppU family phage baseplate upper protein [Acidimicrobiales bacterium]